MIFPPTRPGSADARTAGVPPAGVFKPFHHLSALEYVAEGAWRDQPFQRYLQDKFAELQAQGVDPDVW